MWLLAVVVAIAIAVAVLASRWRRRSERRRRARALAEDLLPEISALVDSVDPAGATEGEPTSADRYEACHQRLPQVLSGEQYFAVETFYQCVASYRDARTSMLQAFAEDDERSLGDRIRAKDRRDRCLKDVYYTGHAAKEKLKQLLA